MTDAARKEREKSHEIYQQAVTLMPGGVNSPARAFGAVGGEPIVFERGEGAELIDVDGNRYIDYVGSWGPMILGHAAPAVTEALLDAVKRGTSFGAPTEAENRLAQLVIDSVPSVEKVRLVNSGTEATMSAIRLARGVTRRDKIIKFAGNYHGHCDSLLVAAGSAAATLGVPNSPGVTAGTAADTIVLPYNDVNRLEGAFDEFGDQIAAVIVEPVAGNMGTVKSSLSFRHALRHLTSECGAILVFAEVMSGFRVALGGAQELFDMKPDLSTFGKVIGGGLPVGAYGGRSDLMDHIMPVGPVFQAGTLSGNPLATAAGIATLSALREPGIYERLERLSSRLANGLDDAATSAGIPHSIGFVGAMLTFFFSDGEVTDWASAERCDTERFGRFFWGMADRGVYLPCSQYEAMFVSLAHTEEMIDRTVQAAAEVFVELAGE